MKTICLDVGHGGHQCGAVNKNRKESDDCLRISLIIRDLLKEQGVKVVLTRSTDIDVTISARVKMCNMANSDYCLAIHRNSSNDSTANGNEIYIFTKASTKTESKAQIILTECCNIAGRNRGVKRGAVEYKDFGINRDTKCPSGYLELGFISNDVDNVSFDLLIYDYAKAIAKALCSVIGVKYTEKAITPTVTIVEPLRIGDIITIIGKYASSKNGACSNSKAIGQKRYITGIYKDGVNQYRLGTKPGNLSVLHTTGFAPSSALTR